MCEWWNCIITFKTNYFRFDHKTKRVLIFFRNHNGSAASVCGEFAETWQPWSVVLMIPKPQSGALYSWENMEMLLLEYILQKQECRGAIAPTPGVQPEQRSCQAAEQCARKSEGKSNCGCWCCIIIQHLIVITIDIRKTAWQMLTHLSLTDLYGLRLLSVSGPSSKKTYGLILTGPKGLLVL